MYNLLSKWYILPKANVNLKDTCLTLSTQRSELTDRCQSTLNRRCPLTTIKSYVHVEKVNEAKMIRKQITCVYWITEFWGLFPYENEESFVSL